MTEALTEWFEIFWQTYPADLSQKKKGAKSVALKSIEKLNPDADLQNKIMTNLRELMRHDRLAAKAGDKVDRWPFASTWINQERWQMLEDITSYTSLNEKIAAKKCQCGKDVQIVDKCGDCHDEQTGNKKARDKLLLANLSAIGLARKEGETRPAWNARCKAYITQKGGLGGVTKKLMG